ncbi:unnamed protein product [Linum trigynum]|uniref:Uncharacterized protein n=1 Tax=Linum trigynum TaxID=586398 RepID=A0AAV2EDZ5_9ROSI
MNFKFHILPLADALLTKQCWRLVMSPDSLVAQVMRSRYYPRGDFWTAQRGYNPSYALGVFGGLARYFVRVSSGELVTAEQFGSGMIIGYRLLIQVLVGFHRARWVWRLVLKN